MTQGKHLMLRQLSLCRSTVHLCITVRSKSKTMSCTFMKNKCASPGKLAFSLLFSSSLFVKSILHVLFLCISLIHSHCQQKKRKKVALNRELVQLTKAGHVPVCQVWWLNLTFLQSSNITRSNISQYSEGSCCLFCPLVVPSVNSRFYMHKT